MIYLLVEEHNVRLPDLTGGDPEDADAPVFVRVPAQLIVLPRLSELRTFNLFLKIK